MKIKIENIGKIKKAEIDLDKQLTVFFGPNNTGKTYVSYCVYGILSEFVGNSISKELLERMFQNAGFDFDKFLINRTVEIDFVKLFSGVFEEIKRGLESEYLKLLPQLFGIYNEKIFDNSLLSTSYLQTEKDFLKFIDNQPFMLNQINTGDIRVNFLNDNNRVTKLFLSENFNPEIEKKDFVSNLIKRAILQFKFKIDESVYFLPAERIGIAVFGKELGNNRLAKANVPIERNTIVTYPAVLNTSLIQQVGLNNTLNKAANEFLILSSYIETEIFEGKLNINENGDIFFEDKEVDNLALINTASTIKSLSSIVFYLRYFAKEGETLIIDEPEINLHPANQVKIARVLARLTALGVKVIVSTHSDYIIREFNNLIMLGSSEKNNKEELMNKYGYTDDEVLNFKNIGAYHFKDGFANNVEVTKEGFEAESIDEEIIRQNNVTTEIRWELLN